MKTKLAMMILVMLVAQGCKGQAKNDGKTETGIKPILTERNFIVPDSTVSAFLGDTICGILFCPKEVVCHLIKTDGDLKPIGKDDAPEKVKLGELGLSQISVLQFLLHNERNYNFDSIVPKSPFIPYLTFDFIKNKKEMLTLYVSFNCEQFAVKCNEQFIVFKYKCKKEIVEYCSLLLPNDEYLNELKKY